MSFLPFPLPSLRKAAIISCLNIRVGIIQEAHRIEKLVGTAAGLITSQIRILMISLSALRIILTDTITAILQRVIRTLSKM